MSGGRSSLCAEESAMGEGLSVRFQAVDLWEASGRASF